MSLLSSNTKGGLPLLGELNGFIQHLLAANIRGDHNPSSVLELVEDRNPYLLKICFYVEKILSDGIKDVNFIGKTNMWDFLENLPRCLPDTERVIGVAKECTRSSVGRGRVFVRLALNEGALSDYLSALYFDQDTVKSYYKDTAIFRNSEFASTFFSILESLSHIQFNLVVKDKDLEKPSYWEDVALTLFSENTKATIPLPKSNTPTSTESTVTTTSTPTSVITTPVATTPATPAAIQDLDQDIDTLDEILDVIAKEDEDQMIFDKYAGSWEVLLDNLAKASKSVLLEFGGKASSLTLSDRCVESLYFSIDQIILSDFIFNNNATNKWECIEWLCSNDLSRMNDLDQVNRLYPNANVDIKLKAWMYKLFTEGALSACANTVFDNEARLRDTYSPSSLLLHRNYRHQFQRQIADLFQSVTFQLKWDDITPAGPTTKKIIHTKIIKKKIRKVKPKEVNIDDDATAAIPTANVDITTPSTTSVESSPPKTAPPQEIPATTGDVTQTTVQQSTNDSVNNIKPTTADLVVQPQPDVNQDIEKIQRVLEDDASSDISKEEGLDSFNETLSELLKREKLNESTKDSTTITTNGEPSFQRPYTPSSSFTTPANNTNDNRQSMIFKEPASSSSPPNITKAIPRSALLSGSDTQSYLSNLVNNEDNNNRYGSSYGKNNYGYSSSYGNNNNTNGINNNTNNYGYSSSFGKNNDNNNMNNNYGSYGNNMNTNSINIDNNNNNMNNNYGYSSSYGKNNNTNNTAYTPAQSIPINNNNNMMYNDGHNNSNNSGNEFSSYGSSHGDRYRDSMMIGNTGSNFHNTLQTSSYIPNPYLIEREKEIQNNRLSTSFDSFTNFHLISDYTREADPKEQRAKKSIYAGEDDLLFINKQFKKSLSKDYTSQLCPTCHANLDKLGFFKTRFCYYTGEWFCTKCHSNQKISLPSRILYHWDFKLYPVSNSSRQYILQNYNNPFDIFRFNPLVYEVSNTLSKVLEWRKKLHFLSEYIETCRNKKSLEKLTQLRDYILTENVHLYSLDDLEKCHTGTLAPQIFDITEKYISHVTKSCATCKGKGFICEFCNEDELLFSWMKLDVQNVMQCGKCSSLAHRACYIKDRCPKCMRINYVKAKHAQEQINRY